MAPLHLLALLLGLLLSAPLPAHTLDDLRSEAAHQTDVSAPTADVSALARWADTFAKEGDCATAFALRRKALSPQAGYRAWRQFAADAACAGHWPEASRALWRALPPEPADPKAAARLWTDLGQALEKRSTWRDDWRDAARESYRKALTLAPTQQARERLKALGDDQAPLRLQSHFAEAGGNGPRICMVFSRPPAGDDGIRYEDYVRFDPPFEALFDPSGRRLCAEGGRWGTPYRVRLRAGLPAAKGRPLAREQSFTAPAVHRKADFWFASSAYVLPQRSRPAVAIQSVNQGRVDLELFHIHERNILSEFVQRRFRRSLGGWALKRLRDRLGESVWQGRADLSGPADQVHATTLRPPPEALAEPGLYVLAVSEPADEGQRPDRVRTLWLVASDIGLTTYKGDDGLEVQARSLATGQPLAGIEVALYARNNTPLARGLSDAQGRARFAPGLLRARGGREPVEITAFAAQRGFSLLRLDRPPRDLSDRGVGGRPAPGPLDAFLSLERDIFRPGETLHLSALLRDDQGRPVPPLPLHLRLTDPRGEPVLERLAEPGPDGGYVETLKLSPGARTGRWQLTLHLDPEAAPLGRVHFQVAAFKPPRMEARLVAGGPLTLDAPLSLHLQARYLFGAPADARPVQARLTLAADPEPFPATADYHFGPDPLPDRVQTLDLPEVVTDAQGLASLQVTLPEDLKAPYPLRAQVQAEVLDVDGRALPVHLDLKVRHLPLYLGIRGPDSLAAGRKARFEFLALDPQGQPVQPRGLHWRLSREQVDYQWFAQDGRWDYRRLVRHQRLQDRPLTLDADGKARASASLTRGTWLVEVLDDRDRPLSALRLQAGKTAAAGTPDKVALSLDRPHYRPGDRARLRIDAPFAGEASLVVAGNGLDSLRNLHLQHGPNEVEVPVSAAWGTGRYLLLNLYRPGADPSGPARALGVIWLGLDPGPRRLDLAFDLPDRARPRGRQALGIRLRDPRPGETVHLVLAAVDEAVLQMTGYRPPDPVAHYYGKRRLGLELRDLYGDLIPPPEGPGGTRSGGGAGGAGRRGAPPSNVRVVSLFQGPLSLDAQGRAQIHLDLPDFDGRLRLMALAWSRTRLGSAQAPLVVRDPVVVTPSLPRFLALGDAAEARVLVRNLEGPAGRYRLELSGDPWVSVPEAPAREIELAPGRSATLAFPLQALRLGEAHLNLRITDPQGRSRDQPLTLGVRGRYLPVREHRYTRIPPGGTLHLDATLLAGLYPADARIGVDLSPHPALPVADLLEALKRYPYGCLEQLVSRTLPLLQRPRLAPRWGLPPAPDLNRRILDAIDGILEKQAPEGPFGLWSADDPPEPWLSAYALDLLQRARAAGHPVPDFFYARGLDYLDRLAAEGGTEPADLAAQAYAHYVLARAGRARDEDLRYLADQHAGALPTPLALAQVAAALAHQGDRTRARRLFARALKARRPSVEPDDYGSALRDRAALLHLLSEAGDPLDPAPLWAEINARIRQRPWLSTQEQAWLILAAADLPAQGAMTLALGDQPPRTLNHGLRLTPDPDTLESGLDIRNLGTGPIWTHIGLRGTPRQAPIPKTPAFRLSRRLYDLQGRPLDPGQLRQGQPLVVVLGLRALDREAHRALLVDLLPAGIEIDNPDLGRTSGLKGLDWLPERTEPRYLDRLDDRLVAALDLPAVADPKDRRDLHLAYLARALTPGRYALPPVSLEDMYRPDRRGLSGSAGTLIVQPRAATPGCCPSPP